MERRFRVFLGVVIALAAVMLTGMGVFTFGRLRDSAARLDREDRAVFASLEKRLADPENIIGVQVQVGSTMGDYDRYSGLDKALLSGMEFVHHEYLYGGTGDPGEDMTITVTLYRTPLPSVVEKLLTLWDELFGTRYARQQEKVILHRDEDVFRVTCGESSFTAACPALTKWLEERK